MRTLFLLYFTLLVNMLVLYGQSLSQRDSVRLYYHHIMLAEQKIMDEQIDSSLWNYNVASKYHKPFMTDAYNALVASVIMADTVSSLRYVGILVSKGIALEYFISHRLFSNMVGSSSFIKYLSQNPESKFNQKLASYISELLQLDQKVRKVPDPYSDSTMYKTDLYIGHEMDSLFALYGYLSEDLVGVFQKTFEKLPLSWNTLDIIMIHQVKNEPAKYKMFFEDAVLDGKMKNSVLTTHAVNFGFDSTYLFKCFYFGMGDLLRVGDRYFTCGKELESLIDYNRARVYLPPLAHTIRASKYRLRNDSFLIGVKAMHFPDVTSQESIDKLVTEVTEQGYIEIYLDDEKRR